MPALDPASIHAFWFETLSNGLVSPDVRKLWFNATPQFDEACRQFEPLLVEAKGGGLADWLTDPQSCLSYIILCDQLPRNIYRSSAEAFAWDDLALAAAKQGITQGFDQRLQLDERNFFYMPFEHAENVLDQHTAVGLFAKLRDDAQGDARNLMGNSLRFAHQHRDIILRFGRFPHRNEILGRSSTPEETAFLEDGPSFGQ